jgi:hypothetical protein
MISDFICWATQYDNYDAPVFIFSCGYNVEPGRAREARLDPINLWKLT